MLDHELALTTKGGQVFNPGDGSDEYGAKVIDQGAASPGDPAVGDPLEFWLRVTVAIENITSYTVALVADSTELTVTSEETLASKVILLAALTLNSKHMIGRVAPGLSSKRYVKMKVTQTGAGDPVGKLEGWLHKGVDGHPVNAATE